MIATGRALADDTRLRILATLLETETHALAVTDLAEHLGLAQPRISTHLAILLEADLVEMRASGRARVYKVNADRAISAMDGLRKGGGLEPMVALSAAAARAIRQNSPYRHARTCYDHLAGRAAVDLLDSMIFDRWLVRAGGPDERPRFEPTETGIRALALIGVDVNGIEIGRRILACGCLDWTERKPHLAGALGAAVLDSLIGFGYARRDAKPRHVTILRDLDGWLSERKPLRN